jgi:hypothetical protein
MKNVVYNMKNVANETCEGIVKFDGNTVMFHLQSTSPKMAHQVQSKPIVIGHGTKKGTWITHHQLYYIV